MMREQYPDVGCGHQSVAGRASTTTGATAAALPSPGLCHLGGGSAGNGHVPDGVPATNGCVSGILAGTSTDSHHPPNPTDVALTGVTPTAAATNRGNGPAGITDASHAR